MPGNHAAYVLGPYLPAWVTVIIFSIGGLTFPVMAFLIAEGYHNTSNLRRYASRLALFAFISQIPYGLLWGFSGNVLITLLLGLASIHAIERLSSPLSKIGAVSIAVAASSFCDWGIIGPLLICLFHVKRGEGPKGIATSMVLPLVVLGLPAVGDFFAIVGGQELTFSPAASAAQVSTLAALGLPTLANATLIGDALSCFRRTPSPPVRSVTFSRAFSLRRSSLPDTEEGEGVRSNGSFTYTTRSILEFFGWPASRCAVRET